MLTSGNHQGDVALREELGISSLLLKPIKQSDLLEAMMDALGAPLRGEIRPAQESPLEENMRRLRILLAEDNAVNQKLAIRILEKRGHAVEVSADGVGALATLDSGSFDLILMDVQMPNMDGFEATAAIRAREESTGGHIPIIAMTASAMTGDRERCLEAGMDGYISKPIQQTDLLRIVEKSVPPTVAVEGADQPDEAVIDKARVLDRLGGDDELLRDVVALFIEECPNQLANVSKAVELGDSGALERDAHTLKGSLSIFGAAQAVDAANRLEEMGRDGNLADASEVFVNLSAEVERLMADLSALSYS